MRIVEARMIDAIRYLIGAADYDGCKLSCDNTTVSQHHHGIAHTPGYQRIISIRLHGNEIAAIRPIEGTVWVSDCGWRTATTKSRLNVIIGALTNPSSNAHTTRGISQRKGQWCQTTPAGAIYAWNGSDVFPLVLDSDNYYLQQAERLSRAA
jgi:hypothetical protein